MGRMLEAGGDDARAIACYEESIALNVDNQRSHYELGALFLRRGELESAELELIEAVSLDPQDLAAAYSYGMAVERMGIYDHVERRLRELVALEPGDVTARYRYGLVLERLGRLDEAMGQYRTAVSSIRQTQMHAWLLPFCSTGQTTRSTSTSGW